MKNLIVQIYLILFSSSIFFCIEHLHAPLYRVIPQQNLVPTDFEISLKSYQSNMQSSNNTMVTFFETDLNGITTFGYYIRVGIGTPPQKFNLIIDTGSSNTAVAGSPQTYLSSYFNYQLSSTYTDQKMEVSVPYDSGKWKGTYSSDIFTFEGISYIDKNKTQKYQQSVFARSKFGLIKESTTFFLKNGNYQGIIGLAYPVLAQPDVPQKSTLLDDLIIKYGIPNMFSVILCGHNRSELKPTTSGYFLVGGRNESLYIPPMVDILIHRKWFYEIIICRISISNKPIILSSCKEYNKDKTILDTGTTDTYLPNVIFHSLVTSIMFHMQRTPFYINNNSPFWERKAVLCILVTSPNHPAVYFPEIQFELVINDTASLEVALSAQQYIQFVGDQIDSFGNKRNCYKFGFGLSKSGTILGDSFLEGFYLLFNRETDKVGIAQSKCNVHFSKLPTSRIIRINSGQQGLLACAYSSLLSKSFLDRLTPTITIIIGLVFGLIVIPSFVLLVYYRCLDSSNDRETTSLLRSSTSNQNLPFYNTVR